MVTEMRDYVVGIDFGTLGGRAVVVRVCDGTEIGSATCQYRHGVIDQRLPATGRELPMCQPTVCRRCGKPTYVGSGRQA